jgi:hypothetical protein
MFHLLGEFKNHLSQSLHAKAIALDVSSSALYPEEEEEEASIFKQNKILLRNECSS